MWPWEHAAVGYLAFSVGVRAWGRRPPTRDETLVLLVGTQFPDLVDKPLAWALAVFPSGTSVAHSVFVATLVSLALWLAANRVGRSSLVVAFAVGYLLHLPCDALYATVTSGASPSFGAFVWPLGPQPAQQASASGLVETTLYYLERYRRFLSTPRAVWYLLAETLLIGSAVVLWAVDGFPGLRASGRD